MRSCTRSGWRAFSIAAAAFITSLTTACDLLSDPTDRRRAEEATLELTGESPVPLLVVMSKEWGIGFDEESGEQVFILSKADTVETEVPYQRTVSLAPTYRILFRVINPDSEHEADVRMRVLLDDDVVYDQQAALRGTALQYSHAFH